MKNVGNSSQGRSQGVPKIFRAPIYRAHCAGHLCDSTAFLIVYSSYKFLLDVSEEYQTRFFGVRLSPSGSAAEVICQAADSAEHPDVRAD